MMWFRKYKLEREIEVLKSQIKILNFTLSDKEREIVSLKEQLNNKPKLIKYLEKELIESKKFINDYIISTVDDRKEFLKYKYKKELIDKEEQDKLQAEVRKEMGKGGIDEDE